MSKKRKPAFTIDEFAVADLAPWAGNPRKNDHTVDAVARSIQRFGFGAPLLARHVTGKDAKPEVIAGHTRLKAAVKLGLTHVPVRFLDLTPMEAHMLAVADNKIPELSAWDDDKLVEFVREALEAGEDLADAGFVEEDLQKLLKGGDADDPSDTPDPGMGEIPTEPSSMLGELYELGPHRLMCGSSNDEELVRILFGGSKAQLVWTDPPYGIDYEGKTKKKLKIQNDAMFARGDRGSRAALARARERERGRRLRDLRREPRAESSSRTSLRRSARASSSSTRSRG